MLNISPISVSPYIDKSQYRSYQNLAQRSTSRWLIKVLLALLLVSILSMFLPWTQNVRSKGFITTLNPYDKPQHIQPLIGGKIDSWYVKEGDIVAIGDTIVRLTEAKEDYLDPELLTNTEDQRQAKRLSAESFRAKRQFLNDQLMALGEYRLSKLEQLKIRQEQIDLEIQTAKLDLDAANTYVENATNQLQRMEYMYDNGVKSLTDLETKKLAKREADAKKLAAQNKFNKFQNDKLTVAQEVELIKREYDQKVSKIESDIRSADSKRFSLLGETTKLQSTYNKIKRRQQAFVIVSPIDGRITKVLKNGIGEFVKAQENIATIVPSTYQKAVELYIEPNDMPLIQEGRHVRVQFDGWPAIIFSGWPKRSFGTFGGRVFAVDNDISQNGKYRILVVEDDEEKEWPNLIRIGSGATGLLLLNDVKVGYELWRRLNGFPPDFYSSSSSNEVKNKAPIRKLK